MRKNRRMVVALIDEHGKILEKPIRCSKCNKKVSLINGTTAHCKRCGAWDIKDLVETLFIEYDPHLTFTESD